MPISYDFMIGYSGYLPNIETIEQKEKAPKIYSNLPAVDVVRCSQIQFEQLV